MYMGKRIAVVVPCKNEATQIGGVLTGMPEIVDAIIVIDDGSTDGMADVVRDRMSRDDRVQLITHERSRGVGGAIAAGYVQARQQSFDITVVMAGDGQMDPNDLELVVYPVAADLADYCKGNRFRYQGGMRKIPPVRKFGNFVLSVLTKIASGYWHVSDTQTGYTAISLSALEQIDVEDIYPTYGCPNDILVRLNVADMRVAEVPINPLYNVGEKSKMRIHRVIGPVLRLLARKFFWRVAQKHLVTNGHPLAFSYFFGFVALLMSMTLFGAAIARRIITGEHGTVTVFTAGMLAVIACQFLLTAFSMDSDANRHLCIHVPPDTLKKLKQRRTDGLSAIPISKAA